ncbi:MAG: NTP transferase domain-containing protein, partial [Coriobacteriales bacterium]
MRYVIMANGKGRRWGGYHGIPKQLISIEGETLLQRTTRLVHENDQDAEVIISSSNPLCVAEGATRHEPERGAREIDRFCYELIDDDVCFLYGDTFYT